MKNKLNKVAIITKSPGWLGVFAGVGLGFGAMTYHHINQEIKIGDQNTVLTTKLVEVAQLNSLLRNISNGQLEVAKNLLSSKLTDDLAEVKSLSPSADAPRREFAREVVELIQHQEKTHPEYYVAESRAAAPGPAVVTQIARH